MSEEKNNKWEMPKPVFKKSEGSLPRSLEETISTSFMANAETIEIDEDDDILGIMDMPFTGHTKPHSGEADDEPILETEPEVSPASDVAEDDPVVEGDSPIDDAEETQPIIVTAKESSEKAAVAGDSGSSFFIFALIALIAVVIAGLYFYFSQNK